MGIEFLGTFHIYKNSIFYHLGNIYVNGNLWKEAVEYRMYNVECKYKIKSFSSHILLVAD